MKTDVRSLEWIDGKVRFLDQSLLPAEEVYVETRDYTVVADALRSLKIRGAPALGVAAAMGVALAVSDPSVATPAELDKRFSQAVDAFSRTRPTAVNLFAALDRVQHVYAGHRASGVDETRRVILAEALALQEEDAMACRRIGESGAALIPAGSSVLTHCNTGALATAGEGTALGVIVTAARQGKIRTVYVDETRPALQGARLTTWELLRNGIDAVLITDSTAATVLAANAVQAVLVGADRIAANGDTANKIGTYPLAVLARRHGVPFYVAAPVSTVDERTASGSAIRIEERSSEEVTRIGNARIAPEGVRVYAPAFDVTPAELITAIVTDRGILRPPFAEALADVAREPAGAS